jgi:hypothetical protein
MSTFDFTHSCGESSMEAQNHLAAFYLKHRSAELLSAFYSLSLSELPESLGSCKAFLEMSGGECLTWRSRGHYCRSERVPWKSILYYQRIRVHRRNPSPSSSSEILCLPDGQLWEAFWNHLWSSQTNWAYFANHALWFGLSLLPCLIFPGSSLPSFTHLWSPPNKPPVAKSSSQALISGELKQTHRLQKPERCVLIT